MDFSSLKLDSHFSEKLFPSSSRYFILFYYSILFLIPYFMILGPLTDIFCWAKIPLHLKHCKNGILDLKEMNTHHSSFYAVLEFSSHHPLRKYPMLHYLHLSPSQLHSLHFISSQLHCQ